MASQDAHIALWQRFLNTNVNTEFVFVQFMGYNANILMRAIPVARFAELIKKNQTLSLTRAIFYLLPHDYLAEGGDPLGIFYLKPDLSTLHPHPENSGRTYVIADAVQEDGVTAIPECPRSRLKHLNEFMVQETGCYPVVGFEVEVVFMKRVKDADGQVTAYQLVNKDHSFQSLTTDDEQYLTMMEIIAKTLLAAEIEIEQFHAEAAPGQWEFVLPPSRPVEAVDTLIRARGIISRVAEMHQLRATLFPRPSESHAGNGAHVHISCNANGSSPVPLTNMGHQTKESFFAGILEHLPAILAFNLPQQESYARVQSGIWSGGEYAAWGWENKEVPLRRIESNHFELKLMDGFANPYLALCAILAAGIDGMKRGINLTAGPCPKGANLLSPEEREQLGIRTLLPKSLTESLDSLVSDTTICESVGQAIIQPYVAIKRGEIEQVKTWTGVERRNYLISRYYRYQLGQNLEIPQSGNTDKVAE
ncbi:FluG family protein [Talaromyces stipitatus ATCC 10500]|uniref:Glutamine synthetase n=1 Tax=Talaromyces stipitatus (strain ATCC 10500 / CBS 375.48 / QM 6759 / NRRL 1006) TaxID=441959 RepID=B8MJ10_TALSN|nr:FluG family protein [Talaromyces stipitatus ATCC 10500]EED15672.1 FluG family protein [Talaromyces stipitatus ATCC 10500]